jgi:hypothetical protein
MAAGDPRPSFEERYGTHRRYVELVETAAEQLISDSLLVPEDARAYVEAKNMSLACHDEPADPLAIQGTRQIDGERRKAADRYSS